MVRHGSLVLLLALSLGAMVSAEPVAEHPARSGQPLLFAKVGDQSITRDEFNAALSQAMRKRFYHGKPPADQVDEVRQEVIEEVITRALLLQEAKSRGLMPDHAAVQRTLDRYDQRYADSPRWKAQRATLLAGLQKRLEEDDVLQQLEKRIRDVTPPSKEQISSYYRDNPDKFTEPATQRVWVIVLEVDPSASGDIWASTLADAEELVSDLRNGAGFADMARRHSSDRTAAQGGDMGYLHKGMLSPAAQQVVDDLPVGAVSDPVRLLEGVAIFKAGDRRPARLRAYDEVEPRARDLLVREQSDSAWREFKQQLRSRTPISVYGETMPAALE